MDPITPEVKERIRKAYADFSHTLREIAAEHRTTVTALLGELDAKHVEKLEAEIKQAKE